MSAFLWLLHVVSTCRAELNSSKVLKKNPPLSFIIWSGSCCLSLLFRESCAALGSIICLIAALFYLHLHVCSLLFFPIFFFFFLLYHVLLFQSVANVLFTGSQEAPVLKLSAGLPLLCVGSGFPPLRCSAAIFVFAWGTRLRRRVRLTGVM